MNCQFYYKGQTVSVTCNDNAKIWKLYDLSIPKFTQHFVQELIVFGKQVKFRLKRNNGILDSKDIANDVLLEKDTIIIEPGDNMLTSSNQNCHTPKRYDISNIENTNSGAFIKSSDLTNPLKSNNQMELVSHSRLHKYQKYEHSQNQPKENHNVVNNFDRNGLRRSLGAAFAPQYDLQSLRENSNYFGSNTNNACRNEVESSDSSISDLYPKTSKNHKIKSKKLSELSTKVLGIEEKRSISKSAPASPTKPVPPLRSPHTHLSMINAHNVRTIGNKINISILKKPNIGLGFTIVTRDNQVVYGSGADIANSVLILVNKILKNGGAADDGRLKPGDRILEVNFVPVSSLKDATDKLRAIPENTTVELLISRIEKDESALNSPSSRLPKTSQLTFEISLNSKHNQNQQLGLNIHYRNEKDNPSLGTGIYIHSILINSLAAQQGGLQVNDKLIGVNGHSLAEMTVEVTINLLKTEMQSNSVLSITVLRESSTEKLSNFIDNNISKSISNLVKNETGLKSDSNRCILPDKVIIDNKSKKSKHRHENRTPKNSNHNRNSSSDSCSQNEYDISYSHSSNAFEREGKGRRSMSEKGKFHEDATQFQIYRNRTDGLNANERPYSTLPTTSHRKKMQQDQSPPPLPNKAPLKPSQIKIKNAQESGPRLTNVTPNRSASLRDSPNTSNVAHNSRSPKNFIQTPTHESQPLFNRAMNNSFKIAVQRSLPDANEQKKSTHLNNSLSHSTGKQYTNHEPTTQSEKDFKNSNQIPNKHRSEKMPRSNSVKTVEKKKSFNIKDFLQFTTHTSQSVKYNVTGKSDTFPPDKRADPQLPIYQTTNTMESKNRPYSPIELPSEFQHCNDQAMIDSAKRVLEWQKKNADVISKENKNKDIKIYQPISSTNNDARIPKTKVDMNFRNLSTKKSTNQYHYETDPYDTIDGTLSSPTGHWKPKSSRSAPHSANNTIYGITGAVSSTKNGAVPPRSNSIIPYQTSSSRKTTSIGNDIYATVNKSNRKESTNKHTSNISQIHKNKYKF